MNRRKPELQAIDLATWPGIAWTDLDTEARKIMRQRMHALELFVQGEPVHAIEKATGVNRRQLYRWLERGLSLHSDGCVFVAWLCPAHRATKNSDARFSPRRGEN
jgi:putative transposase